jgi:hypothetical protein
VLSVAYQIKSGGCMAVRDFVTHPLSCSEREQFLLRWRQKDPWPLVRYNPTDPSHPCTGIQRIPANGTVPLCQNRPEIPAQWPSTQRRRLLREAYGSADTRLHPVHWSYTMHNPRGTPLTGWRSSVSHQRVCRRGHACERQCHADGSDHGRSHRTGSRQHVGTIIDGHVRNTETIEGGNRRQRSVSRHV